jgi:hypothetical protein
MKARKIKEKERRGRLDLGRDRFGAQESFSILVLGL